MNLQQVVDQYYVGKTATEILAVINDKVIPVLGMVSKGALNKLDAALDFLPSLEADTTSAARAAVNNFKYGDGLDLSDPDIITLLDGLTSISPTIIAAIKAAGTVNKSRAEIEGLGTVLPKDLYNIGVA